MSMPADPRPDARARLNGERPLRSGANGTGSHGTARERILTAAEECFARSGFDRTSMDEIAAGAGTTAGNLYRYFPSKCAIVVDLAQRIQDEIEAGFGQETSLAEFLAALERTMLTQLSRRRAALLMEIWSEASRNEAVRQICRGMEERLRQSLRRVLAAPGSQANDRQRAALVDRAIASLAGGLFKRRAMEDDFAPIAEVADMLRLVRELAEPSRS